MRIRHQLTLAIFLTGVLGEAAVLAYRAVSTREILLARAETRAQAIAEVAEGLVSAALGKGDSRSMTDKLELLAQLPGVIDIRVFDLEGKVVSSAQRQPDPKANRASVAGQTMVPGSTDIMDFAFQNVIGKVQVRVSKQHLQERFRELRWRETALGAISLVVLAVVSWLIGNLLGRRLESLAKAVNRMESGEPLKLADGEGDSEAEHLSKAVSNLNERLLSETARRKKLEAFKDDLTNMLVHDMKQPLTVLAGILPLFGEEHENGGSKEMASMLQMAKRSIKREDAMIEDLLQVARLSNPELPLQKRRLSLTTFVKECANENSLIAEQSQRDWRLEIDGDLPACWIYGDAVLLKRLIGNLVLNAVEHSPPRGTITLGARLSKRDRSKAEIFVSDQGPGVPARRREAIFQKFTTFAESAKNVGLGLAFCKMAAEKHLARLELVDPSGPGAIFALVIPISAEPASGDGPGTSGSAEEPPPPQG